MLTKFSLTLTWGSPRLRGEWGCDASAIASAAQLSTTPPTCRTPLYTESVVGDRVLTGISECPMGEECEDWTSTQSEEKSEPTDYRSIHPLYNRMTQSNSDRNGQSSCNLQGTDCPTSYWGRGGF